MSRAPVRRVKRANGDDSARLKACLALAPPMRETQHPTDGPRVGMNDVIYQEAGRHGALVADAYPAFKRGGHALVAGSGNPNDAGHAAIADLFRAAVPGCVDATNPHAEAAGKGSSRSSSAARRGAS